MSSGLPRGIARLWPFKRRDPSGPGVEGLIVRSEESEAVEGAMHVKVRVLLDQEDGWPDTESEGLWALPLTTGAYRLENTPFFAFGMSNGDEVAASADSDGVLWVTGVVWRRGRMTVRIITSDRDDSLEGILAEFAPLGVTGEGFPLFRLLSFDLGPESDVPAAKKMLRAGAASGRWEYEEADVSEEWRAL
jgi:hypothetical protein